MSQAVTNEAEELTSHAAPAAPDEAVHDASAASSHHCPGVVSDCMTLAKPRIAMMVAITAFIGYELGYGWIAKFRAASLVEPIDYWFGLLATLLGTAVACVGAGILNQVYERDTDAMMRRTQSRPLPAGRLKPVLGNLLGLSLGALGVAVLYLQTNAIAAALCAFTILSYWLVYTPMKRRSHLSTLVGAVPGAMPPVIGYTAATGAVYGPSSIVAPTAILLFLIMFLWQLPHFLAIAWMYREDYARAKLPVLPVVEPDGGSTFRQMFLGCAALLPVGLAPTVFELAGPIYFVGALICGLVFLGFASATVKTQSTKWARCTFFASLVYLPVVLALFLIDKA